VFVPFDHSIDNITNNSNQPITFHDRRGKPKNNNILVLINDIIIQKNNEPMNFISKI